MAPFPSSATNDRDHEGESEAPLASEKGSVSVPAAANPGGARTYYEKPWLHRWTGRYTLEWDTPEGTQTLRVHNRLVDLQGRLPSGFSLLRVPKTVWTWWRSRQQPLMPKPYPFLVWDAIRYLDRLLMPGMRVLEVGGGNSTLWLLQRGVHVHTLEPDATWIRDLETEIAQRFSEAERARWTYTQATGLAAIDAIHALEARSLDVVIVDPKGQEIPRCDALMAAQPKLKVGGWLVLDNSDHPNNLAAVAALGKPHHVVTGFGAMCLVVTQTSFWRLDPVLEEPSKGKRAP